jgi:hypothetical protein
MRKTHADACAMKKETEIFSPILVKRELFSCSSQANLEPKIRESELRVVTFVQKIQNQRFIS